jgi:hypothetical protein
MGKLLNDIRHNHNQLSEELEKDGEIDWGSLLSTLAVMGTGGAVLAGAGYGLSRLKQRFMPTTALSGAGANIMSKLNPAMLTAAKSTAALDPTVASTQAMQQMGRQLGFLDRFRLKHSKPLQEAFANEFAGMHAGQQGVADQMRQGQINRELFAKQRQLQEATISNQLSEANTVRPQQLAALKAKALADKRIQNASGLTARQKYLDEFTGTGKTINQQTLEAALAKARGIPAPLSGPKQALFSQLQGYIADPAARSAAGLSERAIMDMLSRLFK